MVEKQMRSHEEVIDTRPAKGVQKEKAEQFVVDAIIPVYGERPDALAATLSACLKQTYPLSQIFVIDDGSPQPVSLPEWVMPSGRIRLLRLAENQGISAARNAAISQSHANFLACVNTEVLPQEDWLATCLGYLTSHPCVGACYTRTVAETSHRVLSRWRMQFQEQKYGEVSGPAQFAPGHAVLFRKRAVDLVGGYDARRRRITEDSDICERMRRERYETHYIAQSQCLSIQRDTLANLCKKQLIRGGWSSPQDYSFWRLLKAECRWFSVRVTRNLVNGRVLFIPIDFAVWAGSLFVALRTIARSRKLLTQHR